MRVVLVAVIVAALTATGAAGRTAPGKGCTPGQTVTLVKRFVTAFNAGDRHALNNELWGGKLYFNWYAVSAAPGLRVDQEARRRDSLMDYLAARHAAGEQLTLTSLEINGADPGSRGFEFQLLRAAADQAGGPVLYAGKGAASCMTGRLTTWVMGVAPRRG
ncbi:MAG TPA: hypothetical protein VGO39_12985 [Gaiellaceae bacterium]|jgi:hypothetical protein|nr:hypothetical protein [Gaiellaceae bacterium]